MKTINYLMKILKNYKSPQKNMKQYIATQIRPETFKVERICVKSHKL